SSALVLRPHYFHRPLHGPEGRKPERLRARRSRNPVVGRARFHHRGGDYRQHLFRYARGSLRIAQLHLLATGARHHSGAHTCWLHFHQALLRLQSLFDLRISHGTVWGTDKECRLGDIFVHARPRVWRATLRCRHRACAGLRNDSRWSAGPNRNAFHLHRRDHRRRDPDCDLHDARRNQSSRLDGFYSSVNHDRQCGDRARTALFHNPGWMAQDCRTPRWISSIRFHHHRPQSRKERVGKMERHVRIGIHYLRRTDRIDIHHDGDTRHRPGHGATNVDRARRSAQPALGHFVRSGRHSDRLYVSEYRSATLGFLPDASGSCITQNAERNFLSLHSLRNASRHSRSASRGNIRHRHGLAKHRDQRTGHQLYPRLVRTLHQSTIDGSTEPARSALGHGLVLDPDDYRGIDNVLSRYRASEGVNYHNRAQDIQL